MHLRVAARRSAPKDLGPRPCAQRALRKPGDRRNNGDANATCTNTAGSFECACNAGFGGDGFKCSKLEPVSKCGTADEGGTVELACPAGQKIAEVQFASYGLPSGECGGFTANADCNADSSAGMVTELCVGKESCTVAASNDVFGDPCGGIVKKLEVQVLCK